MMVAVGAFQITFMLVVNAKHEGGIKVNAEKLAEYEPVGCCTQMDCVVAPVFQL